MVFFQTTWLEGIKKKVNQGTFLQNHSKIGKMFFEEKIFKVCTRIVHRSKRMRTFEDIMPICTVVKIECTDERTDALQTIRLDIISTGF